MGYVEPVKDMTVSCVLPCIIAENLGDKSCMAARLRAHGAGLRNVCAESLE